MGVLPCARLLIVPPLMARPPLLLVHRCICRGGRLTWTSGHPTSLASSACLEPTAVLVWHMRCHTRRSCRPALFSCLLYLHGCLTFLYCSLMQIVQSSTLQGYEWMVVGKNGWKVVGKNGEGMQESVQRQVH